MTPDLFNGLFEFLGGCLLWTSVRRAYRDKVFKGVAILPTAFFASWGFWNLYYYPSLDQWFSFLGGVNIVVANTVWVSQMVWYSWLKPRLIALEFQPAASSGFVPRPVDAPPKWNGGVLCDMDNGPCACGAWHWHDMEKGI